MIKLVENFREFLDLAKINQGPDGWTIYGSSPISIKSIVNYLNWLEERLNRLEELGEITNKDKLDILLSARVSLNGKTPNAAMKKLIEKYGKPHDLFNNHLHHQNSPY